MAPKGKKGKKKGNELVEPDHDPSWERVSSSHPQHCLQKRIQSYWFTASVHMSWFVIKLIPTCMDMMVHSTGSGEWTVGQATCSIAWYEPQSNTSFLMSAQLN